MRIRQALLAGVIVVAAARPALAQRFPFTASFDVPQPAIVDVSTMRGKIDIVAGSVDRILVTGTVTVRIGLDVPSNAVELAQAVANRPPVEKDGGTLRLRPPADAATQRAVTIAYQVTVPPLTEIVSESDSGATSVRGVRGQVSVRTRSAAISVDRLGGDTEIVTGSGSVAVDEMTGALRVTTSSSSVTGRALRGDAVVRTSSGAVDLTFAGTGDADVETGSSAIVIAGLQGGLTAMTRSGSVRVQGAVRQPWEVVTRSGRVGLDVDRREGLDVVLGNQSGSIDVVGATLDGTISRRRVEGTIGGGGLLVRVRSASGSIALRVNEIGAGQRP